MARLDTAPALPTQLLEGMLGVVQGQQSDEPAIGRRHGQVAQLLAMHSFDDRFEPGAGPDRARPGRHRLLRRDVVSAADRAPPEPAEDDTPLIDDETGVPAALVELLADVAERLGQPAGRDSGAGVGSRARLASFAPSSGSPALPQSALPAT